MPLNAYLVVSAGMEFNLKKGEIFFLVEIENAVGEGPVEMGDEVEGHGDAPQGKRCASEY